MADDGHHGKGKHDERHMPVPTVPGACFVVIETEFVFGGFEACPQWPSDDLRPTQAFQGRALGAPCGEEGQIAVGNITADQEAPRPLSYEGAVIFAGIKIGEFEIGPVMQARPFGFLRLTTSAAKRF